MGVYKPKKKGEKGKEGKDGKTWYILYYCDGQRIREAIGPSKSEARAALLARKADILRGEYKFKREKRIQFEDFTEEYLKYAKANKKSWRRDETSLKSLKPFFKGMTLSRISPKMIEEYKQKRLEDNKQNQKQLEKGSPATVNRELALLKFMFSLAIKWEYVDKNPVKGVKFLQEQRYDMRILKKEETPKLLNALSNHLKPIVLYTAS